MWGDNSALGTYGHPAPRCCSFLFRFACLIFSCMASNEIRRTLLEGILFRFAAVTSIPAYFSLTLYVGDCGSAAVGLLHVSSFLHCRNRAAPQTWFQTFLQQRRKEPESWQKWVMPPNTFALMWCMSHSFTFFFSKHITSPDKTSREVWILQGTWQWLRMYRPLIGKRGQSNAIDHSGFLPCAHTGDA